MAQYGRAHQVILNEQADLESDRLRRDMFDGNEDCTRIRIFAASGFVDPYTEEITYSETHTWANASGIVSTIAEKDVLLGDIGGRLRVGDLMVTYHYDSVSGTFLQNDVKEIEVIVPGISGLYQVAGRHVGTFGGRPMFIKVGLKLDSNDQ